MGYWNWYVYSIYKLVVIVYKEGDDRILFKFKRNSLYNFKYVWILIKYNLSFLYLKKNMLFFYKGKFFIIVYI